MQLALQSQLLYCYALGKYPFKISFKDLTTDPKVFECENQFFLFVINRRCSLLVTHLDFYTTQFVVAQKRVTQIFTQLDGST